jgi:hypothetical protein
VDPRVSHLVLVPPRTWSPAGGAQSSVPFSPSQSRARNKNVDFRAAFVEDRACYRNLPGSRPPGYKRESKARPSSSIIGTPPSKRWRRWDSPLVRRERGGRSRRVGIAPAPPLRDSPSSRGLSPSHPASVHSSFWRGLHPRWEEFLTGIGFCRRGSYPSGDRVSALINSGKPLFPLHFPPRCAWAVLGWDSYTGSPEISLSNPCCRRVLLGHRVACIRWGT